jgi:hypothetical protein
MGSVTYRTVPDHAHKAAALLLFSSLHAACDAVTALKSMPVAAVALMDRAALASVEHKPGMPAAIHALGPDAAALLVETRGADGHAVAENVRAALAEDIGSGDITAALVPAGTRGYARIITREAAVICGAPWVDEVFRQLDPGVAVRWHCKDGEHVAAGALLFELDGPARSLLTTTPRYVAPPVIGGGYILRSWWWNGRCRRGGRDICLRQRRLSNVWCLSNPFHLELVNAAQMLRHVDVNPVFHAPLMRPHPVQNRPFAPGFCHRQAAGVE